MSTYLRPGVFVEETLQVLNEIPLETNESVAAFVGTSAKGGPVGPTLVTSWSQYQAQFGDIRQNRSSLSYGLYTFFSNGGSRAYVVRAVNDDATSASVSLNGTQTTPEAVLTATAKSPGVWASDPTSPTRVSLSVVTAATAGRFDLVVEVGSASAPVAREQFRDLTLDPADARYALYVLNSPTVGSKYVHFEHVDDDGWTGPTDNPAVASGVPLVGGSDGTGTPDLLTATQTLEELSDVNLNLALPGVSDTTVLTEVINWAEGRGNVFVVADAPQPAWTANAVSVTNDLVTFAGDLPKSSYVAVYGPWLYISDPAAAVPGALKAVSPSGAVLGQYARTDSTRSVAKAPAGVETRLQGVLNTAVKFNDTQLDALHTAQVNVIRNVPGVGFCLMGARTLNTRTADLYINVRRALIHLKRALINQTRFAVFEPNDEDLYERISAVVTQYLTTQFQVGLLKGETPEQAFYVKCDEELNDAASVSAGVVRVEVGVALAYPAEFVVIRIGQYDGGSTATEEIQA